MCVFLPLIPVEPTGQDQAKGAGGIPAGITPRAAWGWQLGEKPSKHQDKTTQKMSQLLEKLQPDQLSVSVNETHKSPGNRGFINAGAHKLLLLPKARLNRQGQRGNCVFKEMILL